MQKLQKTYELISSLQLSISHLYIKVQPEDYSLYNKEVCDGYPSNRGSVLTSDKTHSFLETVLTCHGVNTNSYFISIMTLLWGIKRPGRKTHYSLLSVNGKFHHITGHNGRERKQRYSSTLSVTSEQDGGAWSTPRPGRFNPWISKN